MPITETILRFRVKKGAKRWAAKGPDLLRHADNARRELRLIVDDVERPMFVKIGLGDWKRVGNRADVMERFDRRFVRGSARDFKVAVRVLGVMKPVAAARREVVKLLVLPNTSPDTILVHSLVKHQFGIRVKFGGAYVWKMSSSTSWSDHAWGTAVDESAYVFNGKLTDWSARMVRAGCMAFDYALGSRKGRVVQISANGSISLSGASKSHLWHVHYSVRDHDGRKPPRTGGVW